LLLCVGVVIVWIASQREGLGVFYLTGTERRYGLTSQRGSIIVGYDEDWRWGQHRALVPADFSLGGFPRGPSSNSSVLIVPTPVVVVATAALPLFWAIGWFKRRWRQRLADSRLSAGLCQQCGYDLRESADRCPECGMPVPSQRVLP
jgi:hypothetical protein